MIVGDDVALRIDDETTADAAHWLGRLSPKHFIKRIAWCLVSLVFVVVLSEVSRRLQRIDVHHGRFDVARNLHKGSGQSVWPTRRKLELILGHGRATREDGANADSCQYANGGQRRNPYAHLPQNRRFGIVGWFERFEHKAPLSRSCRRLS